MRSGSRASSSVGDTVCSRAMPREPALQVASLAGNLSPDFACSQIGRRPRPLMDTGLVRAFGAHVAAILDFERIAANQSRMGHSDGYEEVLNESDKVWCECARVLFGPGRISGAVWAAAVPRQKVVISSKKTSLMNPKDTHRGAGFPATDSYWFANPSNREQSPSPCVPQRGAASRGVVFEDRCRWSSPPFSSRGECSPFRIPSHAGAGSRP